MISLDEYLYSDRERLDTALSQAVADTLRHCIGQSGSACLAVSGGSTPRNMLAQLSRQDLDWSKVYVLLADERWVDPVSERSNERMVRECLLQNQAAAADFKGLYVPDCPAKDAIAALKPVTDILEKPLDILLLGMGEDGHTASLFPCAKNITSLLDADIAEKLVPVIPETAPDERMSLSFGSLIQARFICLHIAGEMKRDVLQKIMAGQKEAPVGSVIQEAKGSVRLYWAP